MNGLDASKIFIDWGKTKHLQIVSTGKEFIWYDPHTGLWNNDIANIKVWICECNLLPYKYHNMNKYQNMMLNQIKLLIPVDLDWYSTHDTTGYIPLKHGVWDMNNKKLVEYGSQFGFFNKTDDFYKR